MRGLGFRVYGFRVMRGLGVMLNSGVGVCARLSTQRAGWKKGLGFWGFRVWGFRV